MRRKNFTETKIQVTSESFTPRSMAQYWKNSKEIIKALLNARSAVNEFIVQIYE